MSGVFAIREKLAAYAPLIAIVPAARIKCGELPLNTAVPAISVMQVSSMPRHTVRLSGSKVMHTDLVQVTVLVAGQQTAAAGTGYLGLRAVLKLVLAACSHQRAIINTVSVDSILPDIEGPDFPMQDPALLSGSRDFVVKWCSA